jgi:AcrR family transcriptional regulator
MAARKSSKVCPRPYSLGKRQDNMDQARGRVLEAAHDLLANAEAPEFSVDAVAREAGVTRQTIYNQFGTRAELIEALFDLMAMRGGMAGMARVMQETEPLIMLRKFVELFAGFWSSDRVAIRRVHALAVLDAELGRIDRARNERRRMAAGRILEVLYRRYGKPLPSDRPEALALLFTITSFEFFDGFAGTREPEEVCPFIVRVVLGTLGIPE